MVTCSCRSSQSLLTLVAPVPSSKPPPSASTNSVAPSPSTSSETFSSSAQNPYNQFEVATHGKGCDNIMKYQYFMLQYNNYCSIRPKSACDIDNFKCSSDKNKHDWMGCF